MAAGQRCAGRLDRDRVGFSKLHSHRACPNAWDCFEGRGGRAAGLRRLVWARSWIGYGIDGRMDEERLREESRRAGDEAEMLGGRCDGRRRIRLAQGDWDEDEDGWRCGGSAHSLRSERDEDGGTSAGDAVVRCGWETEAGRDGEGGQAGGGRTRDGPRIEMHAGTDQIRQETGREKQ